MKEGNLGKATPGGLVEWKQAGRSLVARFESGSIVAVSALAPRAVRVRLAREGQFAPRRSWAIPKPDDEYPELDAAVEPIGEGVALSTSGLAVALHDEGRVDVHDGEGRPVLVDAPDGGPEWERGSTATSWTKAMPAATAYYGFGERTGLLEKRGRRYVCWTTDEWRQQGPTTDPLYLAIPFFLASHADGRSFGLFLATTFRSAFDLTSIADERMQLDVDQGDVDYYVFFGPDPADVVELFTDLVGRMPLPPRWALGYHQSRWGYSTADAVRHVASELRRRRLPSDAIHLDIDHMDGFRTFTWHPERFPDPAGLIGELGQVGFKAVCIVNAGVKYEPDGDYAVYREGHERGMFLRRSLEPGSEEHLGYVWPGLCAFPDHVREDVRGWWGAQYLGDLEIGVAGFLNDMNEPAMHDLPVDAHGSDNTEPSGDLLHGTQEEPVTHAEARNVYAHLENRAAYECLRRARPDERPFLLTRSGYAGVQRFAGVWTGDPTSTWEHLEMSLAQILNLGLSGMAFAGADIGGFFESSSPELLVRWMQLGALTPLARNHSAKDTAAQEPWAWGEEVESACRRALELRYRLMPHLYTLLEETSRTGVPILRPLFFHDPRDEVARRLSDEALLGRDLLLAPVLRPGVAERAVYLPAGAWTDMRAGRRHDGSSWLLSSARLAEEIPLFARSGSIVPMGPVLQWTDERPLDPLTLAVFPGDEEIAEGALYEDDGRSFAYERGESCTTSFRLARGRLVARRAGDFAPPPRRVLIVVHRDGEAIEHEIEQDADEWEADVR